MALANMGFKDQNWSHFRKEEKREGRGRRRREEEEGEIKPKYGTLDFCLETNLYYGFYEIMYEFPCLVG